MPTYQYACTACDHRFEAVQSFSDAALTECPECDGRLRKVFSSVGVVFKGSGFYRTDSRADGKGSNAKSTPTSSETKTSESKTSGTTAPETKSAGTSGSATSGSSTSAASTSGTSAA